MRVLIIFVLGAAIAAAQDTPDDRIRVEFESTMELAAPPADGKKLDEEAAKARADQFKAALASFIEKWKDRAGELGYGRYHLGKALATVGRPEDAIVHFRTFLEANPEAPDAEDALLLLGSAYLDTRDYAAAGQLFSDFVEKRKDSDKRFVARFYLGVARAKQGNVDEALGHLKAVIDSEDETPIVADANLLYVRLLRDAGRIDEAKAHLASLLGKHADAPALQAEKELLDWYGKEAPELQNIYAWLQGGPTTLKDLRGKVVVLNFFADKYEACQVELQSLAKLASSFSGQPVAFVALTRYHRPAEQLPRPQEQELIKRFLADMGVSFAAAIAGDVSNLRSYVVRGIPYTVVIGKDGRIVHLKSGASRANDRAVEEMSAAIRRALG